MQQRVAGNCRGTLICSRLENGEVDTKCHEYHIALIDRYIELQSEVVLVMDWNPGNAPDMYPHSCVCVRSSIDPCWLRGTPPRHCGSWPTGVVMGKWKIEPTQSPSLAKRLAVVRAGWHVGVSSPPIYARLARPHTTQGSPHYTTPHHGRSTLGATRICPKYPLTQPPLLATTTARSPRPSRQR